MQNVHGVQLRAVGSGEAYVHRHQGGILLPQPGHQALFRLVHAGRMGIDVEPVNLLGARLPAYHRAKPALGKAVPQVMLDLGDLGAVAQNLEIDDLIRLIALSVQIVAVGRALHPFQDLLLRFAQLAVMEDAGFVAVHGVDEIADIPCAQALGQAFGILGRQGFEGKIAVLVGVKDGRAVHDDQRGVELSLAHLQGKERRGMLAHQADPCPVVIQIVQPEHGGGRDLGEAVRNQILAPDKKDPVRLFFPGQAEDVHADGDQRADKQIHDPKPRLTDRILDVGKGDNDAEKDDRRQACRIGLADQHRTVQADQHTDGHAGIEDQAPVPFRMHCRQKQQKHQPPEGPDQGAREAADRIIPAVADIGLHAQNGGDHRLGGHAAALVAPQIIDDQAEENRDRGLDDPLPDPRKCPSLSVVYGFGVHASAALSFP